MKSLFPVLCFIISLCSYSQVANNQENIENLIKNYFYLDREIIHVQFNKTTYINNEDIGFKGYVLNKNTNFPFLETTNVQLVIYDEQKQIVQKQLLYASNGTFSGGLRLNKKFKTGKYTFHFYTNWMNNFSEDDSFTQSIEIHNVDETFIFKSKEPNWKTAKIAFFPEGGTIINGINNTIGVTITDCDNKGIEMKDITILDSKLNEVYRFTTNKKGHGVFYLQADMDEKYQLKLKRIY